MEEEIRALEQKWHLGSVRFAVWEKANKLQVGLSRKI